MRTSLLAYINCECDSWYAAKIKVKDFCDGFRDWLPAFERAHWERWRIVDELQQAGFEIGTADDKCAYICGLGPRGAWRVKAGKLVLDVLTRDAMRKPRNRQYNATR